MPNPGQDLLARTEARPSPSVPDKRARAAGKQRCLLVTTKLLESESPRVVNELKVMNSMGIEVSTLEPVPIYLGKGTKVTYSRRLSNLPTASLSRNYVPMYTFPVGSWSAEGGALQRALLALLEPLLIVFDTLLLLAKSATTILRHRPDFVLVLNAPDTGPVVVRMVTSLTRTPYVYACRDPAPLLYSQIVKQYSPRLADLVRLCLDKVEGIAAKGAKFVVTVGDAMSKDFNAKYGLNNCVAVYGSVPLAESRIKRKTGESRPFTIVLTGTVGNKIFDIDLLVEAISKFALDGHDIRLKVIGSVEPDTKSKLSRLGDRVDILGWRPWNEYMAILKNGCDAGVIPLRATEFSVLVTPNKLFDYMAAGLPVIGPRLAGIAEVVQDDLSGVLYSPESADSLGLAMLRLLDPETRRRLGVTSRRLFESRYNEAVQMDKFRAVLCAVAKTNAK
jgi:glycosyltransferase involved in cell wall biosynthesis